MPDFATLLSEHIHNKNIKTYALAQYCNLDRSNMYKIIKGQRKPSSLEMVEKMCKFMHLSPSEQADMEESYHIALIGRENYYRRKAVQQFFEEFRIPTLQLPATSPSNASDYADNATLLHSHLEINRSLLYIIASELKKSGGKISLLIDIQNNIKAQQSAGYRRWATIENLKRIADTSNFLTEHGIGSYEELLDRCEATTVSVARLKANLRDAGAKIGELALKMKHVGTYRQLKPIYDRYKASRDKEKFLRGHESKIILFEAAARECKRLGAVPLPATERMQAEMDELNAKKATLKAELQKAQREERDYAAIRRNVEDFLSPPQPEREQKKNVELE